MNRNLIAESDSYRRRAVGCWRPLRLRCPKAIWMICRPWAKSESYDSIFLNVPLRSNFCIAHSANTHVDQLAVRRIDCHIHHISRITGTSIGGVFSPEPATSCRHRTSGLCGSTANSAETIFEMMSRPTMSSRTIHRRWNGKSPTGQSQVAGKKLYDVRYIHS